MPTSPDATLGQALLSHQSFVQALARKLTNDPHEADDLVQEANLLTLRRRPRTEGALRPWLASVVRGSLWTRRRAAARATDRERRAARPEAQGSPELTRRLELQQEIVQAVLSLPEPYRGTVLLRYYEETSLREIAERQGVPLETARTRLRRAHTLLRERLGSEYDDRRFALLLAPPAKLAWTAGALGSVAVAGLWVGGVFEVEEPFTERAQLAGPSASAAGGHAEVAPATEAGSEQDGTSKRTLVKTSSATSPRDAYWEAVLKARKEAVRFSLKDAVPAEDLSLSRLAETLELPGFTSGAAPGLSARAREIEELTGIEVVVPPGSDQEARLDVNLRQPIRLADLLGILAHEAGPEIAWAVHGGAVHIGLADRVQPEPTEFFHSLADFLVDPDDYFGEDRDPYPIYERIQTDEIVTLVTESVDPLSWDMEGVRLQIVLAQEEEGFIGSDFVPAALLIRHSARVHHEVQRTLDHLRAFYLPDPANERPGNAVPAFDASNTETARALDRRLDEADLSVAYAGAPWEFVALEVERAAGIEVYATTEFRETQADHPVSLVMPTTSVREVLCALERADPLFRWRLDFGRLVFERGPGVVGGRQRLLIRDVRGLFDPPATTLAALPFVDRRPETWPGDEPLTRDRFGDYLRDFVAPDSWDQNSANRLRLSDQGVLVLTHSPRVLVEVERLLSVLRGTREEGRGQESR